MNKTKSLYHGHCFPAVVISCAVRWYFRFSLSLRDIEELLLKRGVVVTCETIRCWCDKFGLGFGKGAKAVRRKPCSTWHLDEMFVTLRGEPHLLWRAVDEHGAELGAGTKAARQGSGQALLSTSAAIKPGVAEDRYGLTPQLSGRTASTKRLTPALHNTQGHSSQNPKNCAGLSTSSRCRSSSSGTMLEIRSTRSPSSGFGPCRFT